MSNGELQDAITNAADLVGKAYPASKEIALNHLKCLLELQAVRAGQMMYETLPGPNAGTRYDG